MLGWIRALYRRIRQALTDEAVLFTEALIAKEPTPNYRFEIDSDYRIYFKVRFQEVLIETSWSRYTGWDDVDILFVLNSCSAGKFIYYRACSSIGPFLIKKLQIEKEFDAAVAQINNNAERKEQNKKDIINKYLKK